MAKVQLRLTAALLLGLCSATATAQAPDAARVTILNVTREQPRGELPAHQINHADCLANDALKMSLELEGSPEYSVEVWAGDSCEVKSNRIGATAICWQVSSSLPVSEAETLELRVRDLLSGRTLASGVAEGSVPSDNEACESVTPTIAPQTLNAFVMLLDGGANVAAFAVYKANFRLHGSATPELASVSSGDGQLLAHLTLPTPTSDQYFSGVQVYCEPSPHDPDAAAPIAASDAGALGPACSASSELIAGAPAASVQHLLCGSASKIATIARADGLLNGVPYNVAVASVDTFGNLGPLSTSVCQVPRASTASAEACSFGSTAPARPGAALALAVTLAAALARRRPRARA